MNHRNAPRKAAGSLILGAGLLALLILALLLFEYDVLLNLLLYTLLELHCRQLQQLNHLYLLWR